MARNGDFERVKVAPPSDTCGVSDCGMPTVVAFAQAVVGDQFRVGIGSDFLDNGAPKSGVVFKGFITRCADCYLRELYRARKGQRSEITGTNPDWDYDTVREYWRVNGLDDRPAVA